MNKKYFGHLKVYNPKIEQNALFNICFQMTAFITDGL